MWSRKELQALGMKGRDELRGSIRFARKRSSCSTAMALSISSPDVYRSPSDRPMLPLSQNNSPSSPEIALKQCAELEAARTAPPPSSLSPSSCPAAAEAMPSWLSTRRVTWNMQYKYRNASLL